MRIIMLLLMIGSISFSQAIDIDEDTYFNEPLDINFKDSSIQILELTYPKKCEIKDKAFFTLSKESIAAYFKNARLYDSKSPVGVRDYPNKQCEIAGKLLLNHQAYDFRLDYGGVGYIHNDTAAYITICNRKECYPCAVIDVYYDALESNDTKWLENYRLEHCVRE